MGVNSMACDHRCFSFSTNQIKINSQSEGTFTDAKARLLTQVEARFIKPLQQSADGRCLTPAAHLTSEPWARW